MKRPERLSFDDFTTAPRKGVQRKPAAAEVDRQPEEGGLDKAVSNAATPSELGAGQATRTDARKALRRLKRERLKGVQNFVNVHLDRDTKRRLKLASFESETSMQALMEDAIRQFLDRNGY